MPISNHERVGRALTLLKEGLYPYIEREMKSVYTDRWLVAATPFVDEDRTLKRSVANILQEDVAAELKLMDRQWNEVFKRTLGKAERSLVNELINTRNNWAHGSSTVSTDDAYRALDSIVRLLIAIASPQADPVEKQRYELLRLRFEDQARHLTRRVAVAPTEGQPISGLKHWREIVTPHPDVASGRYQQAEFAADLWQVYLDEGSDEYRLPNEFFRRTYLTEGLKQLLSGALQRLSGIGGDPVIELQTNFGGGKTHAMLALYHLFLGVSSQNLPGLEPAFEAASVKEIPQNVNTVVLVGNKISPGQVHTKSDGTQVRTLWGEIAWQLGGKEGYEMMRAADETATNPGDALKELFNRYAPCLILIDEWVSYARQLHEQSDLPAGSFDTHFTFAQTLSESAKNADRTLLVVSIPASDIEIGGDRGKEALDRLKNAIGRVESPWRPASAEESFEIVRRRLFQPIVDPAVFVARDAVMRAFCEMYRTQAQEFPTECREADYERRLKEAYPIHPELFDRLYSDWSSLDKFQRTRGVLRLMAKVIHALWEREDRSLLILPAHVPIDDAQVQSELTRYLEDNWIPILEKDVDGSNSLPLALDRENPNLGRYSACRRVARTIYLGSAPTLRAANRGLEERRVKLGCTQPGESVATFSDALRRLSDRTTYLYQEGNRYWISTQPNVTRTARDRATQFFEDKDKVWEEIVRRLKGDRQKGEFSAIHIAPESSADIPDDPNLGVRLVIFAPEHCHSKLEAESKARSFAKEILDSKGTSPRYYKNTLFFLASDRAKLENLAQNVAQYLAWESIVKDKAALNLDVFQGNQAITKRDGSTKDVDNILGETYQWLLSPNQPNPQGAIEWEEIRLQGVDSPILRASRKLIHEEQLISIYSPSRLCLEALVPYLWRDGDRVDLKRLWEYLAQYLYLPRLKNSEVLLSAVRDGVASTVWTEYFAYSEGWDETKQRYLGLKTSEHIQPSISAQNFLVKADVALKQLESERLDPETTPAIIPGSDSSSSVVESDGSLNRDGGTGVEVPLERSPKRFHGTVELDAVRINRDAAQIANEIIQHLTRLNGVQVKITLEIEANIPDGTPDDVVRTVMENCRTLKFNNQAFEQD